MQKKSSRLRAALAAGALVLVPTLSSCGFDYATDAIYNQAVGVNDRSGDVDVLNALIVSGEEGSGTFIATFVHNDLEETAAFEGIGGSVEAGDFGSLEIPASVDGSLNLLDEDPIGVTGDFAAGDFVEVQLTFDTGQVTDIEVPVVPETGPHEGLDTAGSDSPTEDASPTGDASPTEDTEPTGEASPTENDGN